MGWEDDPNRKPFYGPRFIQRATGEGIDTKVFRYNLIKRFQAVHENVTCLHGKCASHHVAEAVIKVRDIPGPIVECGCFKGGMTAKLSVLCKEIGKQLIVFDTFSGLPFDEQWEVDGEMRYLKKGMFAATLEQVEANVREYGEIDVCEFVRGRFRDTIPAHNCQPSLAYIDTDLVTATKNCIKHLWNRVQGDKLFTHDFGYPVFVTAVMRETWWQANLGRSAPEYVRYAKDAKHLAYMKK